MSLSPVLEKRARLSAIGPILEFRLSAAPRIDTSVLRASALSESASPEPRKASTLVRIPSI